MCSMHDRALSRHTACLPLPQRTELRIEVDGGKEVFVSVSAGVSLGWGTAPRGGCSAWGQHQGAGGGLGALGMAPIMNPSRKHA